ncbi:MAG: hypothetical protein H0U49_00180 [Parachlamydiaceae bacterium]|nr:hypothetical protein [Parachlamydiaceae bacterium]
MLTNRYSLLLLGSAGLLFANSCASTSAWQTDTSKGTPSSFNSIRLYLCTSGGCGDLGLELVRTCDGIRLYLNVFGLAIPPSETDCSISMVYVSFRERSYTFCADRLLGGQRLLIPKNVQDDIIEYLQNDQPVFIRVGRYQADIYPEQFLKPFTKMVGAPL